MSDLATPLTFNNGSVMKNRFILAPLTNCQSHANGDLSDDEYHWLTMRARGGFGMTMTCASHVQRIGQGFPGQLGVWDDRHIPGLTRLAAGIREHGSLAVCQLHHAGMRSPEEIIGESPVSPSDNERKGSRGLSLAETQQLVADFVAAAKRAEQAGFDGVELHGAHGYILCQYFAERTNQRDDDYGGSAENRFRILFEIIEGIRAECRADFLLGVRLSGELFGLDTREIMAVAEQLMREGRIDFLDMSLWDGFKEPEDESLKGQTLLDCFTGLERGHVRLGAAGSIRTPQQVQRAMAAGLDWVMLGRAGIFNHDFPKQYLADAGFVPTPTPLSKDHLRQEGLGEKFVEYYSGTWPHDIAD